MANPERGEVGVDVGGQRYTLRPTFDGICELEELVGKPIDEILDTVQQGRRSGLRAVVWACLQAEHAREIKQLKDASAWIERVGGSDRAIEIVTRLFAINAAPASDAGGDPAAGNPPSAQAGIGGRSSSELVGSA